MKKIFLPLLFSLVAIFFFNTSFGQCYWQDTSIYYRVRTKIPYGIAISRDGKVAVSAVRRDSTGRKAVVKIWNSTDDFTDGLRHNDSLKLISPQAITYDFAGNLYIVQTERADSNIVIYNSSLSLIKAINNTPGSAVSWSNPRGIAIDPAQNLYIISGDSTDAAGIDIPHTGKLIKITNPLGAAVKTLVLSHLDSPKAVAVDTTRLFISEFGANKISTYDLATMGKVDSITIDHPVDLKVESCRLYASEHGTNTVKVMDASSLTNSAVLSPIATPRGYREKFGVQLDGVHDLFVCDNDSDRVIFYEGRNPEPVIPFEPAGPGIAGNVFCQFGTSYYSTGGTWSSEDPTRVFITTDGHATGLLPGLTMIYSTTGATIDTFFAFVETPLSPMPPIYAISDTGVVHDSITICRLNTLKLYDPGDGIWGTSSITTASINIRGKVWPKHAGTTFISYYNNNSCNSVSSAFRVRVIEESQLGHITGDTLVCHSGILNLANSTADGRWASNNDSTASVDSATGVVTTHLPGAVDVTYTIKDACGTQIAHRTIIIDSTPVAGTITGADTLCLPLTTIFSNTTGTPGGKWTSSNIAVASVDSTGNVTGIDAGTATIIYTVMNSCDTLTASKDVLILRNATAGFIFGNSSVCVAADLPLNDTAATPGGTWTSSDNTIAVVDASTGVVTGVAAGTATISYAVSNYCFSDTAVFTVTVDPLPHAGAISGLNHVCPALASALTTGLTTGTESWVSADATLASVDISGTVFGIASGATTIYHIATNSCGTDTATFAFTVDPTANAGTISGTTPTCPYTPNTFSVTGAVGTGAWSSSTPGVADIDAAGNVTSYAGGSTVITYTATTVCGSASATFNLDVDQYAYAAPINGIADVCLADGLQLIDAAGSVGADSWYSDASYIADVDASGFVYYYSSGTVNIHHGSTTACSTDDTYFTLNVHDIPVAGGITGPDSVCLGGTINLLSYGTSDPGYWSSPFPAIASVNSVTGDVTGMSATPASVAIAYITNNMCGTSSAYHTVYVKRSSATGTISGPSSVCSGSTIVLGGVNPGGTWSSSNSSIATVNAAVGIVGGAAYFAGTATITYTLHTYSCGSSFTTFPITVPVLPTAGYITGADTICEGAYDTLHNFAAGNGGTWRSRRGHVLFLTATSGIDTIRFQGISAGFDTLVYTVTSPCGSDSAIFFLKVNGLPLDGDVVGPTDLCVGATISLDDPTATMGGTWLTSDYSIASVDPVTGEVTANSGGSVVITYVASTACGSNPDPFNITVNPVAAAVISPAVSHVCIGTSVIMDNTGSFGDGTWVSNNTGIATIDATTGELGGVSAGATTITYTTTTPTCGTATTTQLVTVSLLPNPGTITGPDTVCAGSGITLIDITPSGIWSSDDGSIAVVSSGIVTAVATTMSTTTIRYTVSSAGCGSVSASHVVTVKPLPVAGILSGAATVCRGSSTTLNSTIAGGVWSSPSALVSVNAATGTITGLAVGSATISYAVTTLCGTAYATIAITVTDVPVMSAITAADSLCTGASALATSAPGGGVWYTHFGFVSATPASATTATILAVSAGIDTITYAATNTCGVAYISKTIKIKSIPSAGYITGADSLCPGATATLTNPSGAAGGIWGHSGTHINLTAAGFVTAMFVGTDTVTYTVSNSCGTAIATHTITVNPLPVMGVITGPSGVCVGASISLANATGTPGGTWTCGTGGTITSAGVFTGVAAGPVTVTYTSHTQCGTLYAYYNIIVNPLPTVSPITGTFSVCAGSTASLADATTPGFWTCTPAAIATITSGGVYTGVSVGTAIAMYSVSNLCGTTIVTQTLAINTMPVAAAILGMGAVCPGASTSLYDATTGGVWSLSNSHATISATGLLTGVTTGTDTVYYTVTNACGSVQATRVITVEAVPGVDTIAGPSIACVGMATTLTTAIPGGVWTATNANATVTGGIVTGVTAGIDTIRYAVSNACGSATTARVVTIHATVIPSVTAAVSPNDTLCGATPATYTAIPVNGGTAPFIQWKRGTTNIGTGLNLGDSPTDGDIITCTMASNATCPTIDTVSSNSITMHVYPAVIPIATVTASVDTLVYMGEAITFAVNLINCSSSPSYQWYQNGIAIAGATNATYATTATGSDAYYCIATCNTPCAASVSSHSNTITLHTGYAGVNNVHTNGIALSLYPNPNTGNFNLTGTMADLGNGQIAIEVVDMTGRTLYTGSTMPQQGVISDAITLGNNIVPGQYLLRVITGSGVQVIHFTVSK